MQKEPFSFVHFCIQLLVRYYSHIMLVSLGGYFIAVV